jgi:Mrp family chromosome partitioning ATPase
MGQWAGQNGPSGALSPDEVRGLALRLRQYISDSGALLVFDSLNEGSQIDQLVGDLSRYFAMRDEKVLILDARIANAESPGLARLINRRLTPEAVEVVSQGHAPPPGQMEPGLSGLVQYLVFAGESPSTFICPTRIPSVDLMPAGGPYLLTDVLASEPMKGLLDQLRKQYSLVLVVGPAVSKHVEMEILAAYADGIVVLVNGTLRSCTPGVVEFVQSLKGANAPLLGSVLVG